MHLHQLLLTGLDWYGCGGVWVWVWGGCITLRICKTNSHSLWPIKKPLFHAKDSHAMDRTASFNGLNTSDLSQMHTILYTHTNNLCLKSLLFLNRIKNNFCPTPLSPYWYLQLLLLILKTSSPSSSQLMGLTHRICVSHPVYSEISTEPLLSGSVFNTSGLITPSHTQTAWHTTPSQNPLSTYIYHLFITTKQTTQSFNHFAKSVARVIEHSGMQPH